MPHLQALEGRSPDKVHRVRIYPPFVVRPKGMAISPDVPFTAWPAFKWSPNLPENLRVGPTPSLQLKPGLGSEGFDAVRVDVWGSSPNEFSTNFVATLLMWIRYLTLQNWVGEYEPHTDSTVKYEFEIDADGKAIGTVYAIAKIFTQSPYMTPLDSSIFHQAFQNALRNELPPVYWTLWLDASLYRSSGKIIETVLTLALSLEVARDTIFPRFAQTKARPGLGEILVSPFDGTDLLKHFSSALENVKNRNLQTEQPTIWNAVHDLYVARHHVAHGRKPIIKSKDVVQTVRETDLQEWVDTVRLALQWLETL